MKKFAIILAISMVAVFSLAADYDDPIPWKTLAKYLPQTFSGLAMDDDIDGTTMSGSGMVFSTASAEYGDGDAEVAITHYAGKNNPQFMAYTSQMGINYMDTDEMTLKVQEINGIKAITTFDKEDKNVQVVVPINNQILVAIDIENAESLEAGVKACEVIDFEGLSKL